MNPDNALPTEPGWYMCASMVGDADPLLYSLNTNREWFCYANKRAYPACRERIAHLHSCDPLVRVSFGVAS